MAKDKKLESEAKLRRSGDRCHLISRSPVYDRYGVTQCYNFHYTAGTLFKPDVLEIRHVRHVLFGFYIRRSIDMFAQEDGNAMITMPISADLSKSVQLLPVHRLILRLPERQEYSPTTVHIISMLHRARMVMGADIYTIIYTNWAQSLRNFSYMFLDMRKDVEEQARLARNIRKFNPGIKLICDNVRTVNESNIAFEIGAEMVCCATLSKEALGYRLNTEIEEKHPELIQDVCRMIFELMMPHPQFDMFFDLIRTYPYQAQRVQSMLNFIEYCDEFADAAKIEYNRDMDLTRERDFEEEFMDIPDHALSTLIAIFSMGMLMMRFELNTNIVNGRFTFDPFKTGLIRGRFMELMLQSDHPELKVQKMPVFVVGLASCVELFVSADEKNHKLYEDLNLELGKMLKANQLIRQALNCIRALESLNITAIDEMTNPKQAVFQLKHVVGHYEDALLWANTVLGILAGRRSGSL